MGSHSGPLLSCCAKHQNSFLRMFHDQSSFLLISRQTFCVKKMAKHPLQERLETACCNRRRRRACSSSVIPRSVRVSRSCQTLRAGAYFPLSKLKSCEIECDCHIYSTLRL